MRRGSTPLHVFNTSIDLSGATVFITYDQNGKTILEKTGSDLIFKGTQITCHLSQEETLAFNTSSRVEIQLRYVFPDGTADASKIMSIDVERILKDGVIDYVS